MSIRMILAASTFLLPGAVGAATVTIATDLSYAKDNSGLYGSGATGFNQSTSFSVGIATVGFGAKASSGDVDARADLKLTASYEDTLSFDQAAASSVALSLSNLAYRFSTFVGATATASVNFGSFLGINPPPFNIIDEGYDLTTSASRTAGLGTSVSDTGNTPIAGVGVPTTPGISLQAEVTLDASQQSTFFIDNLVGMVQATHSGGTVRTDAFALTTDGLGLMDLSIAGDWALSLVGVGLLNRFDTALGLAASARIGAAVGFGCGDFSDDDDNGFLCAGDTGAVATSPQLSLIDPAAFGIDWGTKTVSLGTVTVLAPVVPPAPVPLPATGLLLVGGVAVLAGLRRRSGARPRAA